MGTEKFERENPAESKKDIESADAVASAENVEGIILDMEAYQSERIRITQEIAEVSTKLKGIEERLQELSIGVGAPDTSEEAPSVRELREKIHALGLEKVAKEANYPGNWMLLLMERALDPVTKEKFIAARTEALPSMRKGDVSSLDKYKEFASYYESQIDEYKDNVRGVFSETGYAPAENFLKRPTSLGVGTYGESGSVFNDAVQKNGEKLTPRQKDIINAHEKGHGLRDFQSPRDKKEIQKALDWKVIANIEDVVKKEDKNFRIFDYLKQPEEIIERMAQLKNYFGMTANDIFTKEHLEYAREHYVDDVGLDNFVSYFLDAVTSETEENFLNVINKYPI